MATIEKLTHVSEINQLVSQGKEKGYLTYEEVNDVLPSDVVTPDQIDPSRRRGRLVEHAATFAGANGQRQCITSSYPTNGRQAPG